mgnify:CR=1 FL=1
MFVDNFLFSLLSPPSDVTGWPDEELDDRRLRSRASNWIAETDDWESQTEGRGESIVSFALNF